MNGRYLLTAPPVPSKRQSVLRFSVRGLLIAFSVFSIWLTMLSVHVQRNRERNGIYAARRLQRATSIKRLTNIPERIGDWQGETLIDPIDHLYDRYQRLRDVRSSKANTAAATSRSRLKNLERERWRLATLAWVFRHADKARTDAIAKVFRHQETGDEVVLWLLGGRDTYGIFTSRWRRNGRQNVVTVQLGPSSTATVQPAVYLLDERFGPPVHMASVSCLTHDGEWVCRDDADKYYRLATAFYTMYVTVEGDDTERGTKVALDFVREAIPKLNEVLYPDEAPILQGLR